jgi:hypothetical protein
MERIVYCVIYVQSRYTPITQIALCGGLTIHLFVYGNVLFVFENVLYLKRIL